MKVLVIAPHSDDEVLGCGGTIKKFLDEDSSVYLYIVTSPYQTDWDEDYIKQRNKELNNVTDYMKWTGPMLGNLPSLRLDTIPQKEINDRLNKIINLNIKPDILLIPAINDYNSDHRIVHKSCLVATRRKKIKILAYEVIGSTYSFNPNIYTDISNFINNKIEAIKMYKREYREIPHPRNEKNIKALSRLRGSECGCKYAEGFELIREVI